MSAESASPKRARRALASNSASTVVLILVRPMPLPYHEGGIRERQPRPGDRALGAHEADVRGAPRLPPSAEARGTPGGRRPELSPVAAYSFRAARCPS